MRIRWQGLGKAAAVAVAGLVALQALPGLLRPPEPPPLAEDVGLPQMEVRAEPKSASVQPPAESARTALLPGHTDKKRGRTDSLGSHRTKKRSSAGAPQAGAAEEPPPAQSAPVPPPSAAVPSPPAPVPAPTPPSDGSVEFMPH